MRGKKCGKCGTKGITYYQNIGEERLINMKSPSEINCSDFKFVNDGKVKGSHLHIWQTTFLHETWQNLTKHSLKVPEGLRVESLS